MKKSKIIIILGQTATGKSALAVTIAKYVGGEIISCDSRQVYKGLDIGTGKITQRQMRGVPHYLIDVVSSKKVFSVYDFKIEGDKRIKEIIKNGKIPILCGGTGFYIESVVYDISTPPVVPNIKLRKKLQQYSKEDLLKRLEKIDPHRASEIDINNKIRLIRAIEIVESLGKVPKLKKYNKYNPLFIGITISQKQLKKNIKRRLTSRMNKGMIDEVKELHKKGLSYKRMKSLGLEYKYLTLYLEKKLNKKELIEQLNTAIWHYAKKQKTWFKKNKNIMWFNPQKDKKEIIKTINTFIN